MDSLFFRVIRNWIPLAVAITSLAFIIYLVVQQNIRMEANDPQIQMAEDLAQSLNTGQTARINGKVFIATSLAPFTIIYDTHGTVVSSNAFLNGKTPQLPKNVLHSSKDTDQPGENRITWQPTENVRIATVIVEYTKGYVLVGRNMREVEIRENQEFRNIIIGWIISLAATLFSVMALQVKVRKRK